ncbi:Uncharacterized protein TCM_019671 [Theobroma cacao]|uniref:Uncharacterized protein n=1 Tax=Theobroma cacao TaxID=3641 RepID=A0A061EIC2_THECC|nr:Uncharacterized protein TCM_019671 [Theobroma cacao]
MDFGSVPLTWALAFAPAPPPPAFLLLSVDKTLRYNLPNRCSFQPENSHRTNKIPEQASLVVDGVAFVIEKGEEEIHSFPESITQLTILHVLNLV